MSDNMNTDDLLVEVSTALTDIASHLEARSDDEMLASLTTMATALEDIVVALDSRKSTNLSPLIDAINKMKLSVHVDAPKVSVQPVINVQPAAVTVIDKTVQAQGWDISFRYDGMRGVPTGAKLTRIN